jgi:hypothetical protein
MSPVTKATMAMICGIRGAEKLRLRLMAEEGIHMNHLAGFQFNL